MILRGCTPRKEVLHGDLDDAIFAADFGSLIAGDRCPEVYREPAAFFENTHPAAQLKKVVEVVFGRLADPKEAGTMVRLSTGFGGGKTHTLMSLWHLAKNIKDHKLGTDLLPAAGRPKDVTVVAIDAGKAGLPVFSVHGRTQIHSLWGEIFYQLGGDAALKILGKADDPEASPAEKQIAQILPKGPVLFLLDELVIYMAKLSDRGQGNLLGFINSLAAIAAARPQTVLVVTDLTCRHTGQGSSFALSCAPWSLPAETSPMNSSCASALLFAVAWISPAGHWRDRCANGSTGTTTVDVPRRSAAASR